MNKTGKTRVQVMVNNDLVKQIDEYANSLGMTRSSLCCYFIGQGMYGVSKGVELSEDVLKNFAQAYLQKME